MNNTKILHYKRLSSHWGIYALKVILGLVICSPIIFCVMLSLKHSSEMLTANAANLITDNPTLENYQWVIQHVALGTYYKNTIIQCAMVIIAQVILCSFAAYGLVFFKFKGKKLFFTLILMHMMIPGDVVIIMNYIQMQHWHLTDTHIGMALPYLAGGMGIFLMRQFYLTIPRELKEASELDGCSDMGFFFRIALPLSVPSLSSLAIYQFILIYNRYFWPLLVTNTDGMRTIQIGMAMLEDSDSGKVSYTLAGAALCILPVIVVFIFGLRYLIKGMTAGSVKG